jgi:hypothetical protein
MLRRTSDFSDRCGGWRLLGSSRSVGVCGILLAVVVAVMLATRSESQEIPAPEAHIAVIHFEVVEPPVVAQRDITVRAPTSNQQLEEKPLECSGMIWLDGRLVLSSDRHGHVLFVCPVDMDTMTIGRPEPQVIIRNEQELLEDAEGITVRRTPDGKLTAYVMCSLSHASNAMALPKRSHMLRCDIEQTDPLIVGRPTVVDASSVRVSIDEHFKDIRVEPYKTYFAEQSGPDKNTYRWGNVEGITFTPDGSTLLCGMRNPLLGNMAMVFALRGVDEAFTNYDAKGMKLTDLFTLDLGARGVSDMCWDPVTKGYLIAAGKSNGPKVHRDQPFPPNTLDCALFWWSGRKGEKPICFARMPDMKIEAVCRLGSSRFIAVCSDEGDVSEGRPVCQSVLTILDFRGVKYGGGSE